MVDLTKFKPVGEEAPKQAETDAPKDVDLSKFKPVENGLGKTLQSDLASFKPTSTKSEKEKTPSENRLKKVLETTGMGVPLGLATYAAAPYLAAGASALFPEIAIPAAVIAGGIRAAGPISSMFTGALSGFGEETAGQYAQAKEYPKAGEELLRLAGGGITPEFKNLIGYGVKSAISAFGGPSKSTMNEVKNKVLTDLHIEEKNLSPTQRQQIESIFENEIRGGKPSAAPAEKVYSALEKGTEKIVDQHTARAKDLEAQAQELIEAASAAAKSRTAQAQSKVDKISSQFEANIKEYESLTKQRATNIEKAAKEKAEQIRSYAAKESPAVRQLQELDAQTALENGRREVQRLTQESQKKIADLRARAGRTAKVSEARTAEASKELAAVGTPQTKTTIGKYIREAAEPIFNYLKKVRASNADITKSEAFNFAAVKEANGQMAEDTKAFKTGLANLDKKIDDTSLSDIRAPLQRIRNALDPVKKVEGAIVGQPVKFESLEQIRRFLRDRSFGLPAEGFDAINQIEAGKLADMVENIMTEFSPGITKFLDMYKKDSEPLRIFKSKLGQATIGKEDFDMARFETDVASLGDKFFKSETGVKDLMQLLGKDFVSVVGANVKNPEEIARTFVASKLQGASPKEVESFLKNENNRDWLSQFPALKQQLERAAEAMTRAEKFGGARAKVGEKLRSEAGKIQTELPAAQIKVLSQAEKDAAAMRDFGMTQQQAFERGQYDLARQIEQAGIEEAQKLTGGIPGYVEPQATSVAAQKQGIMSEAKRLGEEEVTAAEAQARALRGEAGQLTAAGEKIRQEIMGKAFSQERAQQILTSGDQQLWSQVGPIIKSDPEARKVFESAVRQTLADIGPGAPRNTIFIFEKRLVPAMRSTGLMSESQLQTLQAQINQVKMITDPTKQQVAMSRIARMAVNSIGGEVSRGLGYGFDPLKAYK